MADFTKTLSTAGTNLYLVGWDKASCGTAVSYDGDWYYNNSQITNTEDNGMTYIKSDNTHTALVYSLRYGSTYQLHIQTVCSLAGTYTFTWKSNLTSCTRTAAITTTVDQSTQTYTWTVNFNQTGTGASYVAFSAASVAVTDSGYSNIYLQGSSPGATNWQQGVTLKFNLTAGDSVDKFDSNSITTWGSCTQMSNGFKIVFYLYATNKNNKRECTINLECIKC
jgi:hypothetical protein